MIHFFIIHGFPAKSLLKLTFDEWCLVLKKKLSPHFEVQYNDMSAFISYLSLIIYAHSWEWSSILNRLGILSYSVIGFELLVAMFHQWFNYLFRKNKGIKFALLYFG